MTANEASTRGARARVIVVEDSFPVADSLRHLLGSAGWEVVGMASNVRSALELVAGKAFDVALLDIDLRGEPVTPVAEAVRLLRKPVIFLSGYGDSGVLPPELRALPRLEKPVDARLLLEVIERVVRGAAAG
jgi:DNA-binding NtrC family response regulator